MGNNSVMGVLASMAAGAVLTLGSADASAYSATNAALEFILYSGDANNMAGAGVASSITWGDPATGTGYSGDLRAAFFITSVIEHAQDVNAGYDAYDGADFFELWGTTSPGSNDYFTMCDDSVAVGDPDPTPDKEYYLRRVTRAQDILAGDILAINQTTGYSGHTVLVRAAPTEINPQINPKYAGTKQYAVKIYDATSSNHGCQWNDPQWADGRWIGTSCMDGYFDPGAGQATMRVYTDLAGNLLGYTWSVTSSTTSYYSPTTRPYRVCRLHNLPVDPSPPVPPPPPPPP